MKIFLPDEDVNNYKSGIIDENTVTEKELNAFGNCNELDFKTKFNIYFESQKKKPIGDVVYCPGSNTMIINTKLKEIFEKNNLSCQFFPIKDENNIGFFAINNLELIDALDQSKTEYKYFEGELMDIAKHAFKSNKNYPLLFQIKWPRGIYRNQLYVSEEFINIINENNIQGFDFQQIWDSDQKLEKRLFWTIKNKEKDLYLISSQIVINGIKPYPIKKCILSSKQILWLCSELRKLKKNDIKNGINQLSHLTDDCALYVSISIFKEHANIVLNPLWNNKKLNGLENVLLPISLDSKNPLADNIEPFLLDLEYSIKKDRN